MNSILFQLSLLAQEGAAKAIEGAPKEAAEPAGGGGLFGGGDSWIWMMLIPVMIFWIIMMIMPKKDQAKSKEMLENLKKNDRVLTTAGIKGTIVNVDKSSPFVTVRIDESTNAKMQILRTAIARVMTGDDKNLEETETKS